MTGQYRPVCDCDEPCACYAKGKVYFEMLASLEMPVYGVDCACKPCQVKIACIGALLIMMASRLPELFHRWSPGCWMAMTTERCAELR